MRDKERDKYKSTKKDKLKVRCWNTDARIVITGPFHNSKGAPCDSQQCPTFGDQLCEQEIGRRSTCDQLRQSVRAAAEMDVERPDTRFLQQAPDNQMSRIFQVISSITSTNSQTIRCQVLAAGGTHLICNFSGKIFHCFIIISKIIFRLSVPHRKKEEKFQVWKMLILN